MFDAEGLIMEKTLTRMRLLAYRGLYHRKWYDLLRLSLEAICNRENLDIDLEARIFSALSPQCTVVRNVRRWLQFSLHGRFTADTPRTIRRSVLRTIDGEPLRGAKTRPFAQAILGDKQAIVLDTHMAAVIGVPQTLLSNKRQHALACRLVRATALRMGNMPPRDCQAAIWSGRLLELGKKPNPPDVFAEYRQMIG